MMNRDTSHRGSVLILSLWALLLLSSIVLVWVRVLDQQMHTAQATNRAMEARALARSGAEVALHPGVSRLSPILNREFDGERRYRVQLIPEGGKLNINWMLAGEDPRKLEMLKRFFERTGLTYREREVLVDCMLDWVDGDDLARINGKDTENEYKPANRPFANIDEMAKVHGMEPLLKKGDWREHFTIHSQGPIDINGATLDVLKIIDGVGDARAQRLLQIRQGPDKIDGTKDDRPFKTPVELRSFLGLNEEQFGLIADLVSLQDPNFHLISTGEVGKVSRQVDAVITKVAGAERPTIIVWREL